MSEQPDQPHEWAKTFYRDLQQLMDSTFPKTCSTCGKVYQTQDAFLTETMPVKDLDLEDRSGLFSLDDDVIDSAVGVFRNCVCGSTLMADFRDRRDNSETGQKRRTRFDKLMDELSDKGISSTVAQQELVKILHGESSRVITDVLDDINLS